jgi:hypothetical protein
VTPTLAVIRAGLDRRFANAFEPARPNAAEARSRARDVDVLVTRSAALGRDGYAEEALDRLEDAQIAAARCLEAIIGARLSQGFRGTAHVARKHFLVVALEAWGYAAPPMEALIATTRLRNMLTYEFATADSQFDEAALTAARDATELIQAAIEAIVATAGG